VARVVRDEASPSAPGVEPVTWYEICDESWDLDDCTSALELDWFGGRRRKYVSGKRRAASGASSDGLDERSGL
jgi:hypothetical protein